MITWLQRNRAINKEAEKYSLKYEDIVLGEVARCSFLEGATFADRIPKEKIWININDELPPLDTRVIVKCISRTESDIKVGYKIATRLFCKDPNDNYGFDCDEKVLAWIDLYDIERYKFVKENIFQKLYNCFKYLKS